MELSQLAIFVTAAKYKSFSEAGRRLYISHSTASRAVSALEKELGVKLVKRGSNSVLDLTPAGETLADGASALLAAADELKSAVRAAGKHDDGESRG